MNKTKKIITFARIKKPVNFQHNSISKINLFSTSLLLKSYISEKINKKVLNNEAKSSLKK